MITFPTSGVNNIYNIKLRNTLELHGIGKKYPLLKRVEKNTRVNLGDFWAVKDVSLEAQEGQILGIIGRNGAGKTTLLNIIAGALSPTQGKVRINGRVLGLFNLGVGFQDELTGRENIFLNGAILGASRQELVKKINSIIEFSELGNFIDMPLGTYSQGMRLRLGFSIIINLDFDILIIDEVLAVGDALFQSKCFEKLMDFRRAGKSLLVSSQSMELIERLCDKIALLDHGQLLFYGDVNEGINRYRVLLNTERFFVGSAQNTMNLIDNTKKWSDDKSNWGEKLGTKEAMIESVVFLNKFGFPCRRIKTREPLKVKVRFKVRNKIKDVHFGVAIFRNDGVYCYGTNTLFDGYQIYEKNPGKGWFTLDFKELLLAPGEYRFSVAIWDKNETLAFDYHEGCYTLVVTGSPNPNNELLNVPFGIYPNSNNNFHKHNAYAIDLRILKDKWAQKKDVDTIKLGSIILLDSAGEEKTTFMSNESVNLVVSFNELKYCGNLNLWVGLYRDDGVYCQGIIQPLNEDNIFKIIFPKLPLLPGDYRISLGVWDRLAKRFLICHHGVYPFKMAFNKEDHGTVYLEHSWQWK